MTEDLEFCIVHCKNAQILVFGELNIPSAQFNSVLSQWIFFEYVANRKTLVSFQLFAILQIHNVVRWIIVWTNWLWRVVDSFCVLFHG